MVGEFTYSWHKLPLELIHNHKVHTVFFTLLIVCEKKIYTHRSAYEFRVHICCNLFKRCNFFLFNVKLETLTWFLTQHDFFHVFLLCNRAIKRVTYCSVPQIEYQFVFSLYSFINVNKF